MSKLKCYLNLLIMYCPIISNRENWQLFFTFNRYFAFKYSFRQQIPNYSFSPLNEIYLYLWLYSFFSSELFELLMCSFLDGSKGSSEEVTILQLRFHVWGTKQNYYLASPVSYTSFTYPSMMCNALLLQQHGTAHWCVAYDLLRIILRFFDIELLFNQLM